MALQAIAILSPGDMGHGVGRVLGEHGYAVLTGIIGRSPAGGAVPRIYTSGPAADLMDELDGAGVSVRNLGPAVGRASAIKMCYASLTKGTAALQLAMLAAAHSLGLYGELAEELRQSQGTALAAMERRLPGVHANAGR